MSQGWMLIAFLQFLNRLKPVRNVLVTRVLVTRVVNPCESTPI